MLRGCARRAWRVHLGRVRSGIKWHAGCLYCPLMGIHRSIVVPASWVSSGVRERMRSRFPTANPPETLTISCVAMRRDADYDGGTVVVWYCWWPCREFIEDKLPALRRALKGVKCDVQMKANKHPVVRAEYGELTAASAHMPPPHPAARPAFQAAVVVS
jgi:hypothetical protein